ncbi:MAG: right-handed parallel beta-helix repeat-containing protein, partial [Lachnospiraceae bacterium]|nr:right-handed parallel beta-helix repeat-containing protein [Lachnospiraceae bacterium]
MEINVREYGIVPGDDPGLTGKLRYLLEKYRGEKGVCFHFPAGTYHFYPDYAKEILLYIPNHDEDGLKRTAFDLTGYRGLTIQGDGACFMFHADILPFLIRECEDVRMEGIMVDYARPGYSQGRILSVEGKAMEIEIDKEQFPWYVKGGRVYFYGGNYCQELERWMEMDQTKEGPAYGLTDKTFNLKNAGEEASFEQTGDNRLTVRLGREEGEFEKASKAGNYLILRHHPRNCPAVFIEESRRIQLVRLQVC